jgi:preprotein translocase subunit SecA
MDHLKEGIGLRGYAQQDPLVAYKKESFEMFEAMMLRFQEDTARHLFRMQIIGPDGTPIDTDGPIPVVLQAPQQGELAAPVEVPSLPAPEVSKAPAPSAPPRQQSAPRQSASVPMRAPSTTIDALEKEFQQKKQRDLDAARSASNGAVSNGAGPRRSGEKVGRNDDCPCGSGKKYKKCHGANEL